MYVLNFKKTQTAGGGNTILGWGSYPTNSNILSESLPNGSNSKKLNKNSGLKFKPGPTLGSLFSCSFKFFV